MKALCGRLKLGVAFLARKEGLESGVEVARRPRRAIENLAAIVVVGYVFFGGGTVMAIDIGSALAISPGISRYFVRDTTTTITWTYNMLYELIATVIHPLSSFQLTRY